MDDNQTNRRIGRLLRQGERGMTLIEIMIVLAIIALVMGFLVGPKILQQLKSARVKTASLEAKAIENLFAQWSADNPEGTCPTVEDLKKYRKIGNDPWGKPFVLVCGEGLPEDTDMGVISFGPDKKQGTDDDIRSWEKK